MKNFAVIALLALFVAGCGEDHKDKSASEIARDVCEIEIACEPSFHSSVRECEIEIKGFLRDTASFSGSCGRATEEFLACYSALSVCDGYDDFWLEHPAANYPCRTEKLAQARACEGFSETVEEPPSPAEKYCELEMVCDPEFYGSLRTCLAEIEEMLDEARYISTGCSNAYSDYIACLGQLESCAALDAYWLSEAPPFPCWQEEARVDQQCEDF